MENLKEGTGTPYVTFFDSQGESIIDPLLNVPIGTLVVDFSYTYKEDDDDTASVTIETPNGNLIDHPNLQHLMPISLQWGWIYHDGLVKSSPPRSLVVKDHQLKYTETGVKIELELISASFLLKNEPADYSQGSLNDEEFKYMDYIKDVLRGAIVNVKVIKNEIY